MVDVVFTRDWTEVQAFLAVAEEGSLSAAARRLGSSQPTLGRKVKSLEEALGAALFQREARGLRLSELGQALLPSARAMQEAARQMALASAGRDERMAGTVRLTASEVVSLRFLPAIIARLRAEAPEITIELVASDTSENLLYREADIAVRMYRTDQLDIISRHLGDMQLGMYAAHDYVARRGQPSDFETLRQHEFVGYDRNDLIIRGMREIGWQVDRDFFRTRCDNQNTYWELVRAGCGLGFGAVPMGDSDPALVRIDIPGLRLPVLPVWLAAHEGMRRTPRIRKVWDLLAEGLDPLLV